jgi:hypothetical protein
VGEKRIQLQISLLLECTKQTIYAHFVQLIQTKAVSITEVLPEDKIDLSQLSRLQRGIAQCLNGEK